MYETDYNHPVDGRSAGRMFLKLTKLQVFPWVFGIWGIFIVSISHAQEVRPYRIIALNPTEIAPIAGWRQVRPIDTITFMHGSKVAAYRLHCNGKNYADAVRLWKRKAEVGDTVFFTRKTK